jgi:deferrochelatase/peroxidase EfeB
MGRIQDGIYWDSKPDQAHRDFYKLCFIKVAPQASTDDVCQVLEKAWDLFNNLKSGIHPRLGKDYPVDAKELDVLIGYGHNLFDTFGQIERPQSMSNQFRFMKPNNPFGNLILPGAGIKWEESRTVNHGDTDIGIQFTANSPLAIHRAHIELWRVLSHEDNSVDGMPILTIHDFTDGFAREDKRSWIDFHDGISNLKRGNQREQAIAIKQVNSGGMDWTLNGTYMVFMKIPINLAAWDKISEAQQVELVGRTLRSGCPITDIDNQGVPVTQSGCPVNGTNEVIQSGNVDFLEPPDGVSSRMKLSHVQRANHHRGPLHKPDSRRFFRQGYEFVDKHETGFIAGLNFISFQDDPNRTLSVLTLRHWLGGVAFGGEADNQSDELKNMIHCTSAGVFFVPPVNENEPFPGYNMLQ